MEEKFHILNDVLITAKLNINYLELQEYLKSLMLRDNPHLKRGTKIQYICGIHHTRDDGSPGISDPSLLSGFYDTMFENLQNFCGYSNCEACSEMRILPCSSSIWRDMSYDRKLIKISTRVRKNQYYSKK